MLTGAWAPRVARGFAARLRRQALGNSPLSINSPQSTGRPWWTTRLSRSNVVQASTRPVAYTLAPADTFPERPEALQHFAGRPRRLHPCSCRYVPPPVCLEHGTLEPGWYIDVGTTGAPGEGALRDSIEIWLEALTFVASPTPIL